MITVFNSDFEFSLRILQILNQTRETGLSIDRLIGIDFITVYGRDFGVSEYNLHGNNNFRFSELSCRRDLIKSSIKYLALNRLIQVEFDKDGYLYSISESGELFCSKLNNSYIDEYQRIVKQTLKYVADYSDRALANMLNKSSITAMQGATKK